MNFDKLKDAKNNIEKINRSLEQIEQELKDLDVILRDYDEHDKKALRLKIDDIKHLYQKIVRLRETYEEARDVVAQNKTTCETLEKTLREEEDSIEELENYYAEARNALREMDGSKAIFASEQLIHSYESRLDALTKEKEALEIFQRQVGQLTESLESLGSGPRDRQMVSELISEEAEAAGKQQFIDDIKLLVQQTRDSLVGKREVLNTELAQIEKDCMEQNGIIELCGKNRADYFYAREQIELIREINREFRKKGIREEARMACEYVSGLKDEGWRDAVETFLGVHRYAVIVSPALFDLANEVMDRSSHRYVELVNTKRLMEKEIRCEEDSVFHFLEIQNKTAAAYFRFWLGKIHAVGLKEVPGHDNAMSKEGKLSRNMAVTYMNIKKIKSYCLGSEAIELNRRNAEKRLHELEEREKELLKEKAGISEDAEFLRKGFNCFKEYNLNAHREASEMRDKLDNEKKHYEELLEAQKNNAEFMALSERVSELSRQLASQRKLQSDHQKQMTRLTAETEIKQKEIQALQQQEQAYEQELDAERALSKTAVETAIREYDGYLAGTDKDGGLMQPETKKRNDRRVRELEGEINGLQQAYNNRKQEADRLPVGMEYEGSYQKRRSRIWIDDLQGIQQKLKDQTVKYERIFKREFVLNIYEAAKSARSDISDINKELRKLQFSTRYQFDVKMLNDSSDYARILRYAEYLQETNDMGDGQMSFAAVTGYDNDEVETREREIKEIINRIIDKNDIAEIKKFADYRNYMSYEIIINNDEVKDGKLSKQVGYNSGAGTQIPYTLILSAALSMLYNARVNSVRLIFIDEPFEKMSDHNIRLMLDFFKNQDFQVIFCAPPNKLESIGNECGVIIPVLKVSNDNMQIGEVRFHER